MASSLQRVVLVHNPAYKRSGPKSYVSLLTKYGFTPTKEGPYIMHAKLKHQGKFGFKKLLGGKSKSRPVLQKKDVTSGQIGDVPAEDQQNDSEYLCPVTIGTPGQTFNLDFDTGSSDLWLFSTELPASTLKQAGNSHVVYDSSKSSSYNATQGSTWKISYGDGSSASGTVATDNVNVGGLIIKSQTIELANQLSTEFVSGVGDGLLGLAFDTINTVTPGPVQTPVDNMITQNDIPTTQKLFTANLGSWRDAGAPDKGTSFYTFGYIDQDVLKAVGVSTPCYTPVDNSQGFWMFSSGSASINGTNVTRASNTAIADTGTTLALVDDNTCQLIYNAIPGAFYDSTQQGYVFPSTVTPAQLPVVKFACGNELFAVPKEALAFASAGSGNVYGGIQSRGSMTFDILGDTWLKGIYAVFDVGNTQFGAVQRPDETGNTLAPPQS